MRHETDAAVLQIQFLTNEGALVTSTADDSLHLWNFRQKKPEVVHTLKFQKERITYIHLPLQSKWLYVGTDRGNVHVVNIENFQLSGYVINWNKAIEPCRKTHPGPIVHLSDNPGDSSKLLIGFESGQLVLWDLRTRAAEIRWQAADALRGVAWHHEGKQFVCSHADGSLTTWSARAQALKPVSVSTPHAKVNKDGKLEACKPIQKVEWKASRISGEAYLIFSGGLPYDKAGRAPSITVIHGKTTTVLEMEHNVVDFITLCESPWVSDFQDPYAIVVLLQNDLVVIDLLTPGFPCFENPYPMDLHESPVTCCTYLADCPSDLIPAFYSVGSRTQKRSGFSEREWPVCGGEWSPTSCSYNEIIITGHADGSVKFWDASAGTLQVLYKLKTAKVFEKPRTRSTDGAGCSDDDPFAVQLISLCPESRKLCIAGASSHVVLFKFRKQEVVTETFRLEIPPSCETVEEGECSPEYEYPPRPGLVQRGESSDAKEGSTVLRVRPGAQKKPPGFQAYLVCQPVTVTGEAPSPVTALCINSSYGLMAYGTESGVVVIDVVQHTCVLNMVTPDLYGSADPYQRVPRSPKRINESNSASEDRCRSPSTDQQAVASSAEESGSESSTKSPNTVTEVEIPAATPNEENIVTPTSETPVEELMDVVETQIEPHRKTSLSWKTFSLKKFKNSFSSTKERLEDVSSPVTPSEFCDNVIPVTPDVTPTEAEIPVGDLAEEAVEATESEGEETESPVPPPRSKRKSDDVENMIARPKDLPLFETVQPQRRFSFQQPARKKTVKDLRKSNPNHTSSLGGLIKKLNKLDSSFSRSRSSSMSSLENITSEAVQCLAFADSYTKKSDPAPCPTLWVGTSLGSVLTVMINTPNSAGASDARLTQPTVLTPCGTIFRLKGCILSMSFLDCNGALIPYSYEAWRDENRTEPRDRSKSRGANMSPSSSSAAEQCGDRQFVVLVSEKQARVVALPSQNCVYRQQLADTAFVVKAEIISLKDSVCLVCYLSSGYLSAFSLPSLRPLVHMDFLPLADLRIARTFCFSNRGHGLYLCSPTEVQKFTVSSEFSQSLSEMVGELFLTKEMPEPPKESFFRGLFGGGSRPLDREELFGEQSGRASKSVAKHITGPTMENLNARATTATSEVARAHMLMVERGDKLGLLEEKSERMKNEAENYSTTAHSLMLKYKDKKWYQL